MFFRICHSVNDLMTDFKGKWCIAGGWAIDLYLDKETRTHGDIEILVFREDQEILKNHLKEWEISKVEEGKSSAWKHDRLELPVHELHAIHRMTGHKLEILLNEKDVDN